MLKKMLCAGCLLLWSAIIFAQLTIRVTAVPANTPPQDTLFIAGTFNNWNPGAPNFALQAQADGSYSIVLQPPVGQVEFKCTRGNWQRVEGNAQGGARPNRVLTYQGQAQTVNISILSWEDLGGAPAASSTAAANVQILASNFAMPQLNRQRRIWLYLPPDYATSNKRYPVLYMHDGQNIFDRSTSFSGEWQVDETLNRLFAEGDRGVIVVGIDNGGQHRIDEYAPWRNAQYGGGNGAAYVQFIVETLKPYIDANFRTRPGRDFTGMGGSSLGGLITLYAVLEHQEVFSKALVFSPAFWFAEESYTHARTKGKRADTRIYLLAGALEGNGSVVRDAQQMYNTLREAGFSARELILVTHADGQHSEWYWAREFAAAYQKLFSPDRVRQRVPARSGVLPRND